MLRRFAWILLPLTLTLAVAWAGGFFVTVHEKDAVLTVQAEGCHDYSKARVTGQAEGMVNGKRQSVSLELTPAGKPGAYTVRRQWPAEGKWVLVFNGTSGELQTHTLLQLAADGQWHPRITMRAVAAEEIEAALR